MLGRHRSAQMEVGDRRRDIAFVSVLISIKRRDMNKLEGLGELKEMPFLL